MIKSSHTRKCVAVDIGHNKTLFSLKSYKPTMIKVNIFLKILHLPVRSKQAKIVYTPMIDRLMSH